MFRNVVVSAMDLGREMLGVLSREKNKVNYPSYRAAVESNAQTKPCLPSPGIVVTAGNCQQSHLHLVAGKPAC